jgi:hypothetical protein
MEPLSSPSMRASSLLPQRQWLSYERPIAFRRHANALPDRQIITVQPLVPRKLQQLLYTHAICLCNLPTSLSFRNVDCGSTLGTLGLRMLTISLCTTSPAQKPKHEE